MSKSYKKVLVTGSAGFIGFNIVKEFLNYGWSVFALVHNNIPDELSKLTTSTINSETFFSPPPCPPPSRGRVWEGGCQTLDFCRNNNVTVIKGDVTSIDFINSLKIDVDVVVHAAGLASDIGNDETFRKINFEPVKYLCKIPKKKFIFISTSDVYGIKDFYNADETTSLCEFPHNPYPRYKIKSENWLKENCPVPYIFIRPAAVYGEGDKTLENRVVDFLKTSPFIFHFGKWRGQNRWPLANVKNVAKTIVAVCETDDFNYEAITIIDKQKTTIEEYYRQIAKKYFPDKNFKTITLPFWFGKFLGFLSTSLSNMFHKKHPIFDPTFYAVHHVSSNLDFSCEKMEKILTAFDNKLIRMK